MAPKMRWVYNIILFGLFKGLQLVLLPSQVGIALFCQSTHARFHLKVCLSRIWRNVFQTFDLSSLFNTFPGDRLLSRSCHLWTLSSSCGTIVGWGAIIHNFPSFLLKYKEVFFIDQFYFQGAGHNDVELYNQYLERLKTFVSTELTNWRGPKDP